MISGFAKKRILKIGASAEVGLGQRDQIGRFLKVLGHNFPYKSSVSILGDIFDYSRTLIISKNYSGYFLDKYLKKLSYILFQHFVILV